MEHIAYLDNSSTTKPSKRVIEYITNSLENEWGNPSSLHSLGITAETALINARECIARSINARGDEIIFTGSGTEANNTAILSVLKAKKRGGKIITTAIEHPSVLETVNRLADEGFKVVKLTPDNNGKISLEELEKELTQDTLLVSIMLVNNEVGSIEPIKEAVSLTKKISPNAIFHCDAVQGYGKLQINVKQLGVDLLTASAHKIHGPKGIGFLYCKKGVHINPLITGGGQERGIRSGTEPLPLIMGFMAAVEELPKYDIQLKKQAELFDYAKNTLLNLNDIEINSPPDCLPYILNISVLGYRSETLLHFLEQKDIYVSSGSACAKGQGSYVLLEMGLSKERTDSALRLSFSKHTEKQEIDKLVLALKSAQESLRRSTK